MKNLSLAALALAVAAGAANAAPILQFDVNNINAQVRNTAGANSAFTGVNHSGSIAFSRGSNGILAGMYRTNDTLNWTNLGFSGTMSTFGGSLNLTNGVVQGGNLSIVLSNGDRFTANIAAGTGNVTSFVGGGFIIQAMLNTGTLDVGSDSLFGNVNVNPWLANNGSLPGAVLQFKFQPSANGSSATDMDIFVDVVPLPPAAWAGLATLGGLMGVRRLRRK